MSSRVYTTSEEYLIAVRHCNKAVKEALAMPGLDLTQLMERLDGFVSTIFETRQRSKLDPEVTKVNHLIHKFAAHYCNVEKAGNVGETFCRQMQALVQAEYTTPGHLPATRHVPNAARSAAHTAGTPISNSTTPATNAHAAAVKPAGKPAPTNQSAVATQPVPTVASAALKPALAASSSRTIATPNAAFFSNPTRSAKPTKGPTPADAHLLPTATSSRPAPPRRSTPPMGPVTVVAKRLAEVSLPPIRQGPSQPVTVNPRELESRQTDKGKGKEAQTSQKRKHDDEQPHKADRREYKGTNTFYQIPCDNCATAKRPCEKKDGIKPRKGVASCLACASRNKGCPRKVHPVAIEADLVLVDAEGNIVPPATNSRSKKKRAETDEDMEENEQEDEMPPSKKRQTKVKSAEFVEASDDGNPMDVDVPQEASQPPPSKAVAEVHRARSAPQAKVHARRFIQFLSRKRARLKGDAAVAQSAPFNVW
ncbi:hypothetical protein CPC08DRAFT_731369 [Agrocybe pediades]|nr:hypothetical protein CPC08DRAFT_731369 [Agrocybe pediades]